MYTALAPLPSELFAGKVMAGLVDTCLKDLEFDKNYPDRASQRRWLNQEIADRMGACLTLFSEAVSEQQLQESLDEAERQAQAMALFSISLALITPGMGVVLQQVAGRLASKSPAPLLRLLERAKPQDYLDAVSGIQEGMKEGFRRNLASGSWKWSSVMSQFQASIQEQIRSRLKSEITDDQAIILFLYYRSDGKKAHYMDYLSRFKKQLVGLTQNAPSNPLGAFKAYDQIFWIHTEKGKKLARVQIQEATNQSTHMPIKQYHHICDIDDDIAMYAKPVGDLNENKLFGKNVSSCTIL